MKMQQFAQSAVASIAATISGALFGAAISNAFRAEFHGRGAVPVLEASIMVGVAISGVVLGLVTRALRIRVWPGTVFVILLIIGVATAFFRSNIWQIVYAVLLFALPLIVGVALRPMIMRWRVSR